MLLDTSQYCRTCSPNIIENQDSIVNLIWLYLTKKENVYSRSYLVKGILSLIFQLNHYH
jgi:hypothetical protein